MMPIPAWALCAVLAVDAPTWVLERRIDDLGGDVDRMAVDPGGGVWVVVTGDTTREGRLRVLHRPGGGETWHERYEGPTGTDLSLFTPSAGTLLLGFNRPLLGFRPTLLEITPEAVSFRPTPEARLDTLEFQQVGAYAFSSADEGWACGQRGAVWRWTGGAWIDQPPGFPYVEGRQAESYCNWIELDGVGSGVMGTIAGKAAALDEDRWTTIESELRFVDHGGGLAHGVDRFARFRAHTLVELADLCDAWDAAQLIAAGIRFDERGRIGVTADAILGFGDSAWTCEPAGLDFGVRAVASSDGAIWVLSDNGIYRAVRDRIPTFSNAPPGSLPPRIPYPIPVDVDFDGDDDIVGVVTSAAGDLPSTAGAVGQVVLWRSEPGTVVSTESIAVGARPRMMRWQVAIGDFDGDVGLDLVVLDSGGETLLWRNRGGSWPRGEAIGAVGGAVTAADVDGDGDLDLVGSQSSWLNDGVGRFTPKPYPVTFSLPLAYDFDRDGRAELVSHLWRDRAEWMHFGDEAVRSLPIVAEFSTVGDLDLDGRPELLSQRLHYYHLALPFRACSFTQGEPHCPDGDWVDSPAGIVADLDRDGRPDIIVGSLRVDEMPPGSGSVRLQRAQGFVDVTYATGRLERPTVLDIDGDGDLDVYTYEGGLHLNNLDPEGVVRVRLHAARSDRNAQGAWVVVRDQQGRVAASGVAPHGAVTLGVPDPAQTYEVKVSYPGGEWVAASDVRTGAELEIHDVEGMRRWLAVARLWGRATAGALRTPRDLLVPLACMFAVLLGLAWRGHGRLGRIAFGVGGTLAWLMLVGWTVRAGGALAWLLGPAAALAGTATALGAGALGVRVRGRRAGPFVLLERLGQGTAATVWRARRDRSQLALKLFHPEATEHAESRERFFREARLGAEIDHDKVVKIRDSGQLPDGRCYLAMDLVEGRTLADLLRERGGLSGELARTVTRDVLSALSALHAAGIVHRDVKPENIMIRPDGSAVLTDLGLARSVLFKTVTRHDLALGTLVYMSPEQAVGRPLDGRSDLWSLAVVVYEMLTGERPFEGRHELELVYVIHNVSPEPLEDRRPDADPWLVEVVRSCLQVDVDRRPSGAAALLTPVDRA